MQLVKDVRKSFLVFRCVKNRYRTIKELSTWRESGLKRIELKFNDGSEFKKVPLGSAWSMISYYYWSNLLHSYSTKDLENLYEIGQYIYGKIEETYDKWPKNGWGMQGTHGILYAIIRHYKPKHFLETGIAHGYSATVILTAMHQNSVGILTSIDNSDKIHFSGIERKIGWLVPEEIRSSWELKIGFTRDILPDLNINIDAFYHDSDHSEKNMLFEFEWANNHLASGGFLISDDIDLNRAYYLFRKQHKNYIQVVKSVTTGVLQKAKK
ncbi:MAG: class I SAM-dependent methyltransferase [Thermoplasmatales archaeon]